VPSLLLGPSCPRVPAALMLHAFSMEMAGIRLPYRDRMEAGRALGLALASYANRPDVLVLGLPRGGVPVAAQVAEVLHAPLDVFVVRKLGVPGQEELAFGAIASGGVKVLNDDIVAMAGIPEAVISRVVLAGEQEISRRDRLYRGDRAPLQLGGHTVILIDDGLATGATMRAASQAIQAMQPARLVVAVPVAVAETCAGLREIVDEVVCVATPDPFYAVGVWYEDFAQTSDAEVRDLLDRNWRTVGARADTGSTPPHAAEDGRP
jgi:putative phosphoribosyl transferase